MLFFFAISYLDIMDATLYIYIYYGFLFLRLICNLSSQLIMDSFFFQDFPLFLLRSSLISLPICQDGLIDLFCSFSYQIHIFMFTSFHLSVRSSLCFFNFLGAVSLSSELLTGLFWPAYLRRFIVFFYKSWVLYIFIQERILLRDCCLLLLIFLCGLLLYLVDIWSFLLEMSCLKGSISPAYCLYFKIRMFEEFVFAMAPTPLKTCLLCLFQFYFREH